MTSTTQIGTAQTRDKFGNVQAVAVMLETWTRQADGRTLHTPKASAFGLGGKDFASRAAAVRYAAKVTGMGQA